MPSLCPLSSLLLFFLLDFLFLRQQRFFKASAASIHPHKVSISIFSYPGFLARPFKVYYCTIFSSISFWESVAFFFFLSLTFFFPSQMHSLNGTIFLRSYSHNGKVDVSVVYHVINSLLLYYTRIYIFYCCHGNVFPCKFWSGLAVVAKKLTQRMYLMDHLL